MKLLGFIVGVALFCGLPSYANGQSAVTQVTVYEQSGSIDEYSFESTDARLHERRPSITEWESDFQTSGWECYDVYFSDENGNEIGMDPGKPVFAPLYVTVVCRDLNCNNGRDDAAPNWGGAGNNMDAVELRLQNGTTVYASEVTAVAWGLCDDPSPINRERPVTNVLGPPDGVITGMGGGMSAVTLRFDGPVPDEHNDDDVTYIIEGYLKVQLNRRQLRSGRAQLIISVIPNPESRNRHVESLSVAARGVSSLEGNPEMDFLGPSADQWVSVPDKPSAELRWVEYAAKMVDCMAFGRIGDAQEAMERVGVMLSLLSGPGLPAFDEKDFVSVVHLPLGNIPSEYFTFLPVRDVRGVRLTTVVRDGDLQTFALLIEVSPGGWPAIVGTESFRVEFDRDFNVVGIRGHGKRVGGGLFTPKIERVE